jgi:hypothetical protein
MANYHRFNEKRRIDLFFNKWSYVQSLAITSNIEGQISQIKTLINLLDDDLKINGSNNSKSTNETIENIKKNSIIRLLAINPNYPEYKDLDF